MIQDHLNDDDTRSIHPHIIRLFAAVTSSPLIDTDQFDTKISEIPESSIVSNSNQTSDGKSIAATISIAILTCLLFIGICVFIYYEYKYRKKGVHLTYNSSSSMSKSDACQGSCDHHGVPTSNSDQKRWWNSETKNGP